MHTIKNLISQILDLIYKRKCIHCACAIPDGILCKSCAKHVQNLPCFAQGIINGYKVYSGYSYTSVVKSLIKGLKFKHNKAAANFIAEYAVEYLLKLKNEINLQNAIIIPTPTSVQNYRKRGYDNVVEIAKGISKILNAEINIKALKHVKQTVSQYKLTASQRRKNLEGAFELDKNFNTDKLIILFDDITTTGATLEVLTGLFKERGFNNLICFTFAKTIKD